MTASSDPAPLSVDSGGAGLLAHLHGDTPPAPAWFQWALAQEPERSVVSVAGAEIEVLAWGRRGAPGVLLLHGNGAHADWWSFIAPFLARDRRVTAMTWSGMGGSDWRPAYNADLFIQEALAAAEATGLFDGPTKPLIAAHSFGGFMGLALAAREGARFGGAVILDSPVDPPGEHHDRPPPRTRPNRVYATFEEALARFRLAPAQPCETLYAVDYIARRSIKPVQDGFTWKFDPFIWAHMELGDPNRFLRAPQCPLAIVWGDRSQLMPGSVIAHMKQTAPAGTPFFTIPDADHHVLLDQPLATVSALAALFAAWSPA
jgi:pimeloyl-ACP methyl ester carboxylesterase